MNMYVNLCPKYTENSETVTVDVPTEYVDHLMQYVHILADERNQTARKALVDIVRYSFNTLMEKENDRKSRKNGQRRRRDR
jgi:type IV secretory pathway component VirB8